MDKNLEKEVKISDYDMTQVSNIQLVRLARITSELGLSDAYLRRIHQIILNGFPSAENSLTEANRGLEELELKLRHLIERGATWDQIKTQVWNYYRIAPSARTAARVAEIAILQAPTPALVETFIQLQRISRDFYFHMHVNLREYTALKLWIEKCEKILTAMLTVKVKIPLIPLEKLYLFWLHLQGREYKEAFDLYQINRMELDHALAEYGDRLGITGGHFYYCLATIAIQFDHDVAAREILQKIKKGQPEYEKALELLLQLKVALDADGNCTYTRKLLATEDWRERIRLFYSFFDNSRRLGVFKDHSRPALNNLLADIMRWFPALPEAWSAVSQMLVDNIELEGLLPNLLVVFVQNTTKFYSSLLEIALWEPLLEMRSCEAYRDSYWRGVAKLHCFSSGRISSEEELWNSTTLIADAEQNWTRPLPVNWDTLHHALVSWVRKTPILLEHQRSSMLLKLSVLTNPDSLAPSDVEEYLKKTSKPPYAVLEKLRAITEKKGQGPLEILIISKKAEISHYTNQDMDRLWKLACKYQLNDLGWRIITVLFTRGDLCEMAVHPWGVSGERRNEYGLAPIQFNQVVRAMQDLGKDEIKFVTAILRVGPYIPELLAMLDRQSKVSRATSAKSGTPEHFVEKYLDSLDWLENSKKHYQLAEDHLDPQLRRMPPFIQILPNNIWSLIVINLADRLSISSWHWKIGQLQNKLGDLIPTLASTKEPVYSAKFGRWLRKLTPEQKNSWYDLITVSAKFSELRAREILATLILRMTLMINQNHFQALTSLKTMRVPIYLIWQLENWLLSPGYAALRETMGTANQVAIPLALQKLNTIRKSVTTEVE